jgi:glucose-6-phosphate isomerase
MSAQIAPLTERQAWKALQAHHKNIRELHLCNLFADDPTRDERMAAEAVGLYLDYSNYDSSTNNLIRRYRRLKETS